MRFRSALLLASIGLAAIAALAYPASSTLQLDRRELPADGRSTAHVEVVPKNLFGWTALDLFRRAPSWDVRAAEELGVRVMVAHDRSIVLRAGTKAGTLPLTLRETIDLRFTLNSEDLDEDGFPDAAELLTRADRASFVAWFTSIAEAQATALDDAWPPIHQDCAGLVRFAYKEALREHDAAWREKRRSRLSRAPDVAALRYPHLPFLGDRLFRSTSGSFHPDLPISEQFTAAATAPILYAHNTAFISREMEEARSGDLLFYRVPDGTGSRMHTMIVLGDGRGARVVYHTGLAGEKGEVRLVTVAQLNEHPDAGWHPVAHNPRFLGVHRLALLEHDAKMFGALR
jgi:uncharacterized protein YfaT (DUF1175 family)